MEDFSEDMILRKGKKENKNFWKKLGLGYLLQEIKDKLFCRDFIIKSAKLSPKMRVK